MWLNHTDKVDRMAPDTTSFSVRIAPFSDVFQHPFSQDSNWIIVALPSILTQRHCDVSVPEWTVTNAALSKLLATVPVPVGSVSTSLTKSVERSRECCPL